MIDKLGRGQVFLLSYPTQCSEEKFIQKNIIHIILCWIQLRKMKTILVADDHTRSYNPEENLYIENPEIEKIQDNKKCHYIDEKNHGFLQLWNKITLIEVACMPAISTPSKIWWLERNITRNICLRIKCWEKYNLKWANLQHSIPIRNYYLNQRMHYPNTNDHSIYGPSMDYLVANMAVQLESYQTVNASELHKMNIKNFNLRPEIDYTSIKTKWRAGQKQNDYSKEEREIL